MPKTRKPRGGAAAAPDQAMALEKAKEKLSPEDQEKYASLLEDFDKQVEKKIKEIENAAKAKADSFYRECMVEIMKLPTTIRNLNWEATAAYLREPEVPEVSAGTADEAAATVAGTDPAQTTEDKENDEIRQLRDEIAEMKTTAMKTTAKSTVKRSRVNANNTTRASKRLTAAAGAATPGGLGGGGVDESILTSTVNRTAAGKGGRGRRVLQTPGNISMVCPPRTTSKGPMMNTMLVPATPAALAKTTEVRQIRPGEILYSENWSPATMGGTTVAKTKTRGRKAKGAAAAAEPDCKVEIGGGRELQIKVDDSEAIPDLKLDPEALAKIKAVRSKLDQLLKSQK